MLEILVILLCFKYEGKIPLMQMRLVISSKMLGPGGRVNGLDREIKIINTANKHMITLKINEKISIRYKIVPKTILN